MNAVIPPGFCKSPVAASNICDLDFLATMHRERVADCYVTDLAYRTRTYADVARILRGQHDVCPGLRKAAPDVLHHIAFEQHSRGVLDLKAILHDELGAEEARICRVPKQWLEEVIAPNLDVGGNHR